MGKDAERPSNLVDHGWGVCGEVDAQHANRELCRGLQIIPCRQLRPVLIVLELGPLTLRKLKDDNKTREIQNLRKSTRYPLLKEHL